MIEEWLRNRGPKELPRGFPWEGFNLEGSGNSFLPFLGPKFIEGPIGGFKGNQTNFKNWGNLGVGFLTRKAYLERKVNPQGLDQKREGKGLGKGFWLHFL